MKRFVSLPNKCLGCPLEKIVPMGFKMINACDKAQNDYAVEYGLNDLGKTVCKVSEKKIDG